MKLATLTIALLVGSSTAALAHPHSDRDDVRRDRIEGRWRDHRGFEPSWRHHGDQRRVYPMYRSRSYQAPVYQPPTYPAPIYQAPTYQTPTYQAPVLPTYQSPTYQSPTYDDTNDWMTLMSPRSIGLDGRAFVRVDSSPGAIHALRLDATRGDTFVTSVDVEYTDGRHQIVPVGQELDAENPSFELALDSGCGIADITVEGRSERGGIFALSAL